MVIHVSDRRRLPARSRIAATVLVATAWGCGGQAGQMTDATRASVHDTVLALFQSCIDEEMHGNPEVCLGQMSRSPAFRYFVNTALSRSADSITTRTRRGFAHRLRWEMEVRLDTVVVLGPDAAVLTANLHVTSQDSGGPVVRRPASWTLVYARDAHGWSIVHGHWTYGDAQPVP